MPSYPTIAVLRSGFRRLRSVAGAGTAATSLAALARAAAPPAVAATEPFVVPPSSTR
jgi:hypothetical protein